MDNRELDRELQRDFEMSMVFYVDEPVGRGADAVEADMDNTFGDLRWASAQTWDVPLGWPFTRIPFSGSHRLPPQAAGQTPVVP